MQSSIFSTPSPTFFNDTVSFHALLPCKLYQTVIHNTKQVICCRHFSKLSSLRWTANMELQFEGKSDIWQLHKLLKVTLQLPQRDSYPKILSSCSISVCMLSINYISGLSLSGLTFDWTRLREISHIVLYICFSSDRCDKVEIEKSPIRIHISHGEEEMSLGECSFLY